MKEILLKQWGYFKNHSLDELKKMVIRTMILVILTIAGLWMADALVDSGMTNRFALVRRFPEFIPMMMAAAKFTFIEMSLEWIRYATRPKLSKREKAAEDFLTASNDSKAASPNVMYVTNAVVWAIRVAVFIYLMG